VTNTMISYKNNFLSNLHLLLTPKLDVDYPQGIFLIFFSTKWVVGGGIFSVTPTDLHCETTLDINLSTYCIVCYAFSRIKGHESKQEFNLTTECIAYILVYKPHFWYHKIAAKCAAYIRVRLKGKVIIGVI